MYLPRYEEGDDEMKRTIGKAWTEGQDKKVLEVSPSLYSLGPPRVLGAWEGWEAWEEWEEWETWEAWEGWEGWETWAFRTSCSSKSHETTLACR